MKVDLSKEEKEQLQDAVDTNKVRHWLQLKDEMKFTVGDVLIKMIRHHDYDTDKDEWNPEQISYENKMPQRYVYVHEDEFGIGWVKPLRVSDGTLGQDIQCITDLDLYNVRFQVDPEYAEHVLLDADFDIKELHKKSLEARKIIQKMNRKNGKKLRTIKECNEFFKGLKRGDHFWTTSDYTGRYENKYKITKLEKLTVKALDKEDSWTWKLLRERHTDIWDDVETIRINYRDESGDLGTRLIIEWRDFIFYKTEPAKEDNK